MDLQVGTEMSIALSEDGVSMEVVAEENLYCLCETRWDINNRRFMIHCDHCQNWFHGDCVGITEHQSKLIDKYSCPRCESIVGPSKYKEVSDVESSRRLNKRYSPEYRRRLQEFCFLPSDEIIITREDGSAINLDELISNGFFRPIIVDEMNGLGLRVPPSTFSIRDVEDYLEPDRLVDVIDVEKQVECRMTFHEFAEYFVDVDRKRLLNLISLEVSSSKLGGLVEAPYIARKLDFVRAYWPEDAAVPDGPLEMPAVTKYCLISAKDSYTDFHIDFGGTSVWYHVLWGQKVFYLMEPTKVNLDLYNQWLRGDFGNECFLPDEIQQCYRCVLNKGQTLFIPTGWIHAVYTPHDSLVFGGNFLNKLNMGLQLQIHAMERKSAIAAKYLFPNFETTHWYAANGLVNELKSYHKKRIPPHILQGVRDLIKTLIAWLDEYETKKAAIPIGINPHGTVKALKKEIRHVEKSSRKFDEKHSDDSPKLTTGSLCPSSTGNESPSNDIIDGARCDWDQLGNSDAEVRIKMKISRKSIDEWSPRSGENSRDVDKSHSRQKDVSWPGLSKITSNEDDSQSSFECLYIDETGALNDKKGKRNSSKWDTDSSIVSSESRHKKTHKGHKNDKERKHRHHKSKHKKSSKMKERDKSHSQRKAVPSSSNRTGERQSRKNKQNEMKNQSMSLNDALAGALDGMEDLIESSNYSERLAQSKLTAGVKETVRGLGSMKGSVLPKNLQTEEDIVINPIHQDDDYIYLPLVASDDEKEKHKKKKKRTRDDDDETWSPTGKLGSVGSRTSNEPRQHAKKKGVQKCLQEAASRPSTKLKISRKNSPDKAKKKKSVAGPSRNINTSSTVTSNTGVANVNDSNKSGAKKWKKGMQTPKQRLGKILKIGKYFSH